MKWISGLFNLNYMLTNLYCVSTINPEKFELKILSPKYECY